MPRYDFSSAPPSRLQSRNGGDIFSTMREEMDRMFEHFERGLTASWPDACFPTPEHGRLMLELDVRDNGDQSLHRGGVAGRR